jgi:RimJ/RimL family protein N-acetyltransferase
LKATSEALGWIGFGGAGDDNGFGYALLPEHRGHGYMTEALDSVLRFCFTGLGNVRVIGSWAPSNVASANVMLRCRMRPTTPKENGNPRFMAEAAEWLSDTTKTADASGSAGDYCPCDTTS